jgi:L-iditol 2-dehydrogenase
MSTDTGSADIPRTMRASVLVATGPVDVALLITGRFDLDHAEEALNADLTPGSLKAAVHQ